MWLVCHLRFVQTCTFTHFPPLSTTLSGFQTLILWVGWRSSELSVYNPLSQSYGFSIGHVWMWELDYKESLALKNWCFWTVVLEKTLESPLDCKEIKPVNPEGNQSWIFIERTNVEAEAPILWPPDSLAKTLMAGKIEGRSTTEDETVGWHHWLDGHEFEQALRVANGQGSLVCCIPWGGKESYMTERQTWTDGTTPKEMQYAYQFFF